MQTEHSITLKDNARPFALNVPRPILFPLRKAADEALDEIAKQALDRKTGARGLRGVIESAMLDIMYEIPSKQNVKECIIDDKVIRKEAEPKLIFGTPSSKKPDSDSKKDKGAGSAESA